MPHYANSRPPIQVITTRGILFLSDLTDDEAAWVARHWNAARRYLQHGDEAALADFYDVDVGGFELETDPYAIERYATRGDLDFESIYDDVV